jgi:hypothetical protein
LKNIPLLKKITFYRRNKMGDFFQIFVAFLEYMNFKDLRVSKGLSYQEFKLDYLIRYINLSLIYVSMGTWYFNLEKGVQWQVQRRPYLRYKTGFCMPLNAP